MRSPYRLATLFAASLSIAGSVPLLGAGCSLGIDPILQIAEPSISAPATVAPGKQLEVTATFVSASNVTLEPGEVTLDFTGDSAWKDASLALAKEADFEGEAKFSGKITAPGFPGKHHLSWVATRNGVAFGEPFELDVEVTCSDGVFCNGVERFVNGACVPGTDPCDDKEPCTTDTCDEKTGRCMRVAGGGACAACYSDCVPDCTGKECGDNGCGGDCGKCGAGKGCAAATGVCADAAQAGTCGNPLDLLPPGTELVGKHVITGDTTNGLNETIPTCNSTSLAAEVVYQFVVKEKVGIEATSSGYDTVLSLRSNCLDNTQAATIACSDDSSPPSNYGSRVNAVLNPGTYYLIVDGFDSTQFGPFTLNIKAAADGCIPNCDGQLCGGNDGCGGDCGSCGDGFLCKNLRCYPNPCTPDCGGKTCGDDGCGGECGACKDGALCVPATGNCQTFAKCDHDLPVCEPACGSDEFCGTDCECHAAGGALPDLVVEADRLAKEILFDTVHIPETSCAIAEECVGAPGDRKVLRFSVEAVNQGTATLTVPPPDQRPDLFQFSACHGHYHFTGFALYRLLDQDEQVVLTGRKQAYCMEDTRQVLEGPEVSCSKQYDCSNQGITAGWSDLYGNTLDCQWLDITDVPAGDYTLEVMLNPARTFQELSFENNVARVPVTIP